MTGTTCAAAGDGILRNVMRVAHVAVCAGVLLLGSGSAPAADPAPLSGVTRLVTSVGVAANDANAHTCRLDRDSLDNRIIDRLRSQHFEPISIDEVVQAERRQLNEVRRATESIRRNEPPPDDPEQRRARREAGRELAARPVIGFSFAVASVNAGAGVTCVLVAHVRLTGSAVGRVALGATGRDVVAPLLLWESRSRVSVSSEVDWQSSLNEQVAMLINDFLEQWRLQNR